jgi:hypothetical protein
MILIFAAMLPILTEAQIYSMGTYFWVSPTTDIVSTVGTTFNITINIANAPPTYSWQLTFNFNNNTLGVKGVTEGPWLKSAGSTFWVKPPPGIATANKSGTLNIFDTLMGSSIGASHSGVLCTITLCVEAAGTSALYLTSAGLVSPTATSVAYYPCNSGYFSSSKPLHDIGITSVTASPSYSPSYPSAVSQGSPDTINVNVTNEGSSMENFSVTVTAQPNDTRLSAITIGTQFYNNSLASGASTILTFTWTTSSVPGGFYILSTTATITTPSVTDQNLENNMFIGPMVWVQCPYDVAVLGVTTSTILAAQTMPVTINVTVKNEGIHPESFNVTVLVSQDQVTWNVVAGLTNNVTGLPVNSTITKTVTWYTTGALGLYYIKATVPKIENQTSIYRNTMVDGYVLVIIMDGAVVSGAFAPKTVYRGALVLVNATVKNLGNVQYPGVFGSTMLILSFNETNPSNPVVGGTPVYLGVGENETYTFIPYATAELPPGNYSVVMYLIPVPLELNIANNYYIASGTFKVSWWWGDVVLAGTPATVSDMLSIRILLTVTSSLDPTTRYKDYPSYDVNFDGQVNVSDLLQEKIVLSVYSSGDLLN